MTRQAEHKPATVPLAQQAGEIPAQWRWVKPCAWTIRMLTALLTGVKGQKWFRLIDKVYAERNLWAAFQQVAEKKGAPGADRVTVAQFEKQLPDSIWELSDQLRAGQYRPVEPVHVPADATDVVLEQYRRQVEDNLNTVTARAYAIVDDRG